MNFNLVAAYTPTGDQPQAIEKIVQSVVEDKSEGTTLLGVTGSGKTFTIANAIAKIERPTLVISHNKTLAAQLYKEFQSFFPNNAVEYFVSYYDYYQPEAYLPATDTYIEKDLSINDEIERLRLKTVATLLSGRRDVIVVSSVSCIYGCGNPDDFHATAITLRVGETHQRNVLLRKLVEGKSVLLDLTDDLAVVKLFINNGCFKVWGLSRDPRIFTELRGIYLIISYRYAISLNAALYSEKS
jgi:excinuclease ABC subunit B